MYRRTRRACQACGNRVFNEQKGPSSESNHLFTIALKSSMTGPADGRSDVVDAAQKCQAYFAFASETSLLHC